MPRHTLGALFKTHVAFDMFYAHFIFGFIRRLLVKIYTFEHKLVHSLGFVSMLEMEVMESLGLIWKFGNNLIN